MTFGGWPSRYICHRLCHLGPTLRLASATFYPCHVSPRATHMRWTLREVFMLLNAGRSFNYACNRMWWRSAQASRLLLSEWLRFICAAVFYLQWNMALTSSWHLLSVHSWSLLLFASAEMHTLLGSFGWLRSEESAACPCSDSAGPLHRLAALLFEPEHTQSSRATWTGSGYLFRQSGKFVVKRGDRSRGARY